MQAVSFSSTARLGATDYRMIRRALAGLLDLADRRWPDSEQERVRNVRARLVAQAADAYVVLDLPHAREKGTTRVPDSAAPFVEVAKDEALDDVADLGEAAAVLHAAGLHVDALALEGAATRILEALIGADDMERT